MQSKVFHSITNKKGVLGIKCKFKPIVAVVSYKSPFASIKQNNWLEKELVKVYSRYYYRVLLSTSGRFWEETKTPRIVVREETQGGMSNDISLKEFIGR